MRNKHIELVSMLNRNQYDILCLTESMTKPLHIIPFIPGYKIVRKDIVDKGQRGTCILVRDDIKIYNTNYTFPDNHNIELQIIKVQLKYNKCLIIANVYRHPDYSKNTLQKDYKFLKTLFKTLLSTKNDFVCLGDFNLKNKFIAQIDEFCVIHQIKQLIKSPTRENNILDLIFVKETSKIKCINILDSYISDHDIIECIICIEKATKKLKSIQYRSYKNCIPAIMNHLEFSPKFPDFKSFHEYIISIFDSVCPMSSKKITQSNRVFPSKTTKYLIRKHRKMFKASKKWPMRAYSSQIKILKKQVKRSMLCDSKHQFNLLLKKDNLWSAIDSIAPLKDKRDCNLPLCANDINKHYVEISTNLCSHDPILPNKPLCINPENKLFILNFLSTNDVMKAWKAMKNKNSTSIDPIGLCNKMINICMQSYNFIDTLTQLFNSFILNKHVPSELKTVRIVPIPKNSQPKTPNDTRPIAIQSVITKILDKCLLEQMRRYFENNNFISDRQFGFKRGSGTTHALIAITDKLYENIDNNELSCVLSLDIQKAFDKVNRSILVEKLKWYGIDEGIITSLLTERYQFVETRYEGKCIKSSTKETTLGIAQGSSTSAFYFNIFINDLPLCISSEDMYLYADDSNVIKSCKNDKVDYMVKELEYDIRKIQDWMEANHLKLNISKTKIMFVGKKAMLRSTNSIKVCIDGSTIERVDNMKILGVFVDENLNWKGHIASIKKKCYASLSRMYRIKKVLSLENKIVLAEALVFSHIRYACIVYLSNKCKSNMNEVDKIIRSTARFILNQSKYDPITELICTRLEFLFAENMYIHETLTFAYKCMFMINSGYFHKYLNFSNHEVLSTRNHKYVVPNIPVKSFWGKITFKYNAVYQWMNLPNNVYDEVESLYLFRKTTQAFLLTKQCERKINVNTEDDIDYLDCINNVIKDYGNV